MKPLSLVIILAIFASVHLANAQTVRITQKPEGIVHGELLVPVTTADAKLVSVKAVAKAKDPIPGLRMSANAY